MRVACREMKCQKGESQVRCIVMWMIMMAVSMIESQRKEISSRYLPDMFQVSHGEVDSRQAGVDTSASGDPDRTVDVQRGSKQLALLLRLSLCRMLDGCFF